MLYRYYGREENNQWAGAYLLTADTDITITDGFSLADHSGCVCVRVEGLKRRKMVGETSNRADHRIAVVPNFGGCPAACEVLELSDCQQGGHSCGGNGSSTAVPVRVLHRSRL